MNETLVLEREPETHEILERVSLKGRLAVEAAAILGTRAHSHGTAELAGVLRNLAMAESGGITRAQYDRTYVLRYYGDPSLMTPVDRLAPGMELPLQLVDAMRRTLRAKNGRGIAAPHVGGRVALIIVPIGGVFTLLGNPKIVGHSRTSNRGEEGSLSTPNFHWSAVRWDRVTVKFEAWENGARGWDQITLKDPMEARILQHQLDALAGRPVPDSLSRQQRRQCERLARKYGTVTP